MNTVKMVVFDMAGTTVNENNVVYKTLHKAINEAGFPVSLHEVLTEGAGKEKLQAVKSILHEYAQVDDDEVANQIHDKFLVLLEEAYQQLDILPQPNAEELFKALKGRKILNVLNTGYNRKTALSITDKLGWKEGTDFDCLVTATDVGENRPNPDMIFFAMKQFHITDASTVVKVGDSIIDIEEGKNAGCGLNIGITTGAHSREQLASANPDAIINDLMELLPLI
jgi:phosphonatase-like hydrolase